MEKRKFTKLHIPRKLLGLNFRTRKRISITGKAQHIDNAAFRL